MRAELWHSLRPLLAAGGSHKAQDWKLLPTRVPPTPTQLQAPPPVLGGSQVWGVGQAAQVTEALPILACVSRQPYGKDMKHRLGLEAGGGNLDGRKASCGNDEGEACLRQKPQESSAARGRNGDGTAGG